MEPLEEKKASEEVKQKHEKLADDTKGEANVVELVQNKYTENVAQPFISQTKVWEDDEHFKIPDDILNNVINELGFKKPSIIQGVSIPLITKEPYNALIA